MAKIAERVDRLEEALMRLVYIQQKTEIEIQNLKREMQEFKDEIRNDTKALKEEMKAFKDEIRNDTKALKEEMKAFKDEMKVFKDEMLAFKDEMRPFKDEMKAFKDEMLAFKDEMKMFKDEMLAFKEEMKLFKDEMVDFKEWSKRNIENMNRQWGALANKMGTLVEDIFAPSIEIVLKKYFAVEPEVIDIRKSVRRGGESLEIDLLAMNESEKKVFVVEAKATPDKNEYVEDFEQKLKILKEFLPSLREYKVYGIYAALNMNPKTVELLTKKGIYAMVLKGDILEIVNFDEIEQKAD